MARPKKPVRRPTRRSLTAVGIHASAVAKLLELVADEMGEGGRAARLASKGRMSGDPELRMLMDVLQRWRDEDFTNWQKEMAGPPKPSR